MVSGPGEGGGPHVMITGFGQEGELKTISSFFAFDENFRGGIRVDAGDVDKDSKSEIVVGAGPSGGPHVRVFEKDGTFIGDFWPFHPDFRGGVDVACGDVDGDGKAEIAMSQFSQGQAWIKVYRLDAQKTIIGEWNAYGSFEGGATVTMADVDGDGKAEVITGAGSGGGPHVRVFEADGTFMMDFWPFHPDFRGGVDVSAGDMDGDGKAEIVMSQRSMGEAWIKVYKYDQARTILSEFRAYPAGLECGANIKLLTDPQKKIGYLMVGAGEKGGFYPLRWLMLKDSGITPTAFMMGYYPYSSVFEGGMDISYGMF